jgi:hypothetical protein
MRIEITIETGNAAFVDYGTEEIARILHKLANSIEQNQQISPKILDINGNTVGEFKVSQ